MRKCPLLVL
jgi:hypothetical protein